jgi:hypothetical protein
VEYRVIIMPHHLSSLSRAGLTLDAGRRTPDAGSQRAGPDSDQLPTSHTCFNTLLLPDYPTDDKMRERLQIAISECEGFGLQ